MAEGPRTAHTDDGPRPGGARPHARAQLLLAETQLAEAARLLERFQHLRLQPDNHTCCSVLLLYLKQARLLDARDLYDEMKRVRRTPVAVVSSRRHAAHRRPRDRTRRSGSRRQRNYITSPTMTVMLLAALGHAEDAAWVGDFHTYLTRKGRRLRGSPSRGLRRAG